MIDVQRATCNVQRLSDVLILQQLQKVLSRPHHRQLPRHIRLLRELRDLAEHGQVLVGDLQRRGHDQEEVLHRLAVDRIEVDAVELAAERYAQAVHGERATVRNRDILTDARRPERLATLQHLHEGLLGLVIQLEQAHELFQDVVFGGALQLQVDRVFGKELTQAHVLVPPVETAAKRNEWLLLAQRVITLCAMDFPYRSGHAFPLFLAPMSGVSESPFRLLCRRFGADVVVSEFISAVGVARGLEHLFDDMRFEEAERPIGIQLYGADATVMARAAEMVTEAGRPDFIDINFGCPVKKVVKNNGGSGCLKDLDLVERIIRAVRSATHLPVTVKIRSGWDDTQRDPVTIARRCREAGAQALTLHARTRTQMFSGVANWDEIARVVEALDIPVIGNGDITTAADVVAMRAHTNCAGVMIARGSFGNPWIFAQARDLAAGRPARPDPSPDERFATALEHARLALRLQGDTRKTALEFRKHFGWYTKGVAGAASLRERLFQIESMQQAEAIFAAYLAGSAVEQAA